MSRNRVLGDNAQVTMIPPAQSPPAAAGFVFTEPFNSPDDVLFLNPTLVPGTPSATIKMNPQAQDGDELTISDAFGVLAVGTTLVVDGNGNFIADGGAAAATQTYSTAGTGRRFMFTNKVQSGGTINSGTWIRLDT